MKRKLIEYEVFEKMRENSLSAAVHELAECEDQLARALDKGSLVLESYDDGTVVYETDEGTFVRANYQLENRHIKFDNIEELVINEETERKQVRKLVEGMLEALLEDNEVNAGSMFKQYMEMARTRYKRNGTLCTESMLDEAYVRIYGTRGRGGKPRVSKRTGGKDRKKSENAKKGHRLHPNAAKEAGRKRHANVNKERQRRKGYKRDHSRLSALSGGKQYRRQSVGKKRMVNEWLTLSRNVLEFCDWKESGYLLKETYIRTNESGDVVMVKLPNSKARNEGKLQQQKYKNMVDQTNWKVLRENARRLAADETFCQAVADIKRYNNVSDNAELEESIGGLVSTFPAVLYLTQEELARTISSALDNLGVTNYDDTTCNFMAEGILRVAHDAYSDRVEKILQYANKTTSESGDQYAHFQVAAREIFPTLDESIDLERRVFEDLYNATMQVRAIALESENDAVRSEAHEFLGELEAVLTGRAPSDIDLAEEVADWLNHLAETNLPGASDSWEIVRNPHQTITGDHPQMAKNAKVAGIPGTHEGDWGDPAPMIHQDKKGYKGSTAPEEARNRSWGNKGGKDVWPSLQNPNIPSPFGDYKMKGEKSVVDDGNNFGTWGSSDTFPGLQNPYVPNSVKVHVNSDNRVDTDTN